MFPALYVRYDNNSVHLATKKTLRSAYLGKPAELSDTCNPDWVPHINMGYSLETDPEVSQLRYIRSLARQRKSQESNDEPLTEVESGMLTT